MNRKFLIISIVAGISIIIFLVLAVWLLSRRNSEPVVNPGQTVTTITIAPVEQIITPNISQIPTPVVVSSNPAFGQTNVPVSTKNLTITLKNANLANSETATVTFQPPTLFSYKAKDNSISITFLNPLEPGTTYSYSVSTNGSPEYYGHFITAGPTPTGVPGLEPAGYFEAEKEYQIQEFPDIYLSNDVPFETSAYKIEATKGTDGIYTFTVTRKGSATQESVKQLVEQWIVSKGLAQEQISELRITYK